MYTPGRNVRTLPHIIQNAERSNRSGPTHDFTGAPHSSGESSTNPTDQTEQSTSESIYHRVSRVEDQVKEISEGMKSFQTTRSNPAPSRAPRVPRTVNDNALMASTLRFLNKLYCLIRTS